MTAKSRTVVGRKVKKLRIQGLLPGNIYGKKVKSQAVSVDEKVFRGVFATAGETGLVDLMLEGKKLPVLIHNVSYHPITNQIIHADFYQVDLKEKVTANVPLAVTGEAPAVKDKTGVLLTNLDELQVEALPQDLPDRIEVDISGLVKIDDAVKVTDLKVSDKIKILTDTELEVVKIGPLTVKEKIEEPPVVIPAEGEAAEAQVEGVAAEGKTAEDQGQPAPQEKKEKQG